MVRALDGGQLRFKRPAVRRKMVAPRGRRRAVRQRRGGAQNVHRGRFNDRGEPSRKHAAHCQCLRTERGRQCKGRIARRARRAFRRSPRGIVFPGRRPCHRGPRPGSPGARGGARHRQGKKWADLAPLLKLTRASARAGYAGTTGTLGLRNASANCGPSFK
jgi:hypothetical protein